MAQHTSDRDRGGRVHTSGSRTCGFLFCLKGYTLHQTESTTCIYTPKVRFSLGKPESWRRVGMPAAAQWSQLKLS